MQLKVNDKVTLINWLHKQWARVTNIDRRETEIEIKMIGRYREIIDLKVELDTILARSIVKNWGSGPDSSQTGIEMFFCFLTSDEMIARKHD